VWSSDGSSQQCQDHNRRERGKKIRTGRHFDWFATKGDLVALEAQRYTTESRKHKNENVEEIMILLQ
jgi:hypothetical protein